MTMREENEEAYLRSGPGICWTTSSSAPASTDSEVTGESPAVRAGRLRAPRHPRAVDAGLRRGTPARLPRRPGWSGAPGAGLRLPLGRGDRRARVVQPARRPGP